MLPKILPRAAARAIPSCGIELRETQTKLLLDELTRGALDVVMLALPVPGAEIETIAAVRRPVPACGAGERSARRDRARRDVATSTSGELILLEEGHCLRDQALAYCADGRRDGGLGLGATSLATVMQMVANGYGVTLVPQVAVDGRGARRAGEAPALCAAAARPHHRSRLAAHLAAQGRFRRAGRGRHRNARHAADARAGREAACQGERRLTHARSALPGDGHIERLAADKRAMAAVRRMHWLKLASGLIALALIAAIWIVWRWSGAN